MTQIIIIAAHTLNNVIGKDGTMPWHLPEDLKFFKKTTLGCPMVMGRKTRESFGPRPLPNRPHLVVSRNEDYTAEGTDVFTSIPDAILHAKEYYPDKDIFIVGGGEIYKQTLQIADKLILSEIQSHIDGDRTFPIFDKDAYDVKVIAEYPDTHPPFIVKEYNKIK